MVQFAYYLRRVSCKPRLIFPRIKWPYCSPASLQSPWHTMFQCFCTGCEFTDYAFEITWLPHVKKWSGKKNSWRSGKSQGISLLVREKSNVWKKLGKSEILRVHFYCFPSTFAVFKHFTDMNCVALVKYCSWNCTTSWCCFFKNIIVFLHVMLTSY